jgi:hypothetical protein
MSPNLAMPESHAPEGKACAKPDEAERRVRAGAKHLSMLFDPLLVGLGSVAHALRCFEIGTRSPDPDRTRDRARDRLVIVPELAVVGR